MGAALALRGDLEGPQTLSGGTVRDEPARWQALVDGTGCPIRRDGEPLDVPVERGAERVGRTPEPMELIYEIQGNRLPLPLAHVFPCFRGDRFIGGAIDPRGEPVLQSPDQLARLRAALTIP